MYPRNFKPLIIVGRQRAGTRFLTSLLNSFEEVTIQGEVPTHVMEKVTRFIRDLDSYYGKAADRSARHDRYYKIWRRKKEHLLVSIWEYASQSRSVKSSTAVRGASTAARATRAIALPTASSSH
jgi:hypothetical protein